MPAPPPEPRARGVGAHDEPADSRDQPAHSRDEAAHSRDEAALVEAVAEGDAGAFATLVERHAGRVLAVCRRELGADDAEDAAQEVFARLWRHAATFQGRASLATWLHRVAINCCRDVQRKAARRPRRTSTDVAELAESLADPAALEDVLAGRGIDAGLRAHIEALPRPQREVVVLVDVCDLPLAEVAARQGVAVGTVKSRLHRAHARLAAAWEPDPPAPTSHE